MFIHEHETVAQTLKEILLISIGKCPKDNYHTVYVIEIKRGAEVTDLASR